ncbi:quinone oxidoreductase [Nitzschia inconspicua]|uniref:Quinone oxidoreductase n=1 Tax=Nitzschia inconspicua TaxID=303405 RepID=A0A9K3KQW7_9STRA|nr:quinone oxidoreductase [Nitzschia inconspicua]
MSSSISVPDTMKAIVVSDHGGPEALRYVTDFEVPKNLSEGEILIKNEYAGLNFIDTYYRTGLYKQELPFVSGQEGAGTVCQVHESVTSFQVGDKVVYSVLGTYCEYTLVSADKAVKLPDTISMEAALCCMVQGLTAHYLVTDATAGLCKKGDWMLIYSVGSGTCQWAAQMAKLKGYKVIGTTSENKVSTTIKEACDHLIALKVQDGKSHADYTSVDIHKQVMEITGGEGVKCIVDGVGKSTADISVQCLARRGLWISFGNASGAVPPFSLLKLTPKSGYVTRPKLGDYVATKEELQYRTTEVFEFVSTGKVKVNVDGIFPLQDASEAHTYLESGKSKGKILFKI